jgi:hypothetical protein
MNQTREIEADMMRTKVSREHRKELRKADLRSCSPEERRRIRQRMEFSIKHVEQFWEVRRASGQQVPLESLARSTASARLTIECLDEIEREARS